jgi:hypothetical protein
VMTTDSPCAETSFMINVLIDRGLISDIFLHKYYGADGYGWCPHCINTKLRALYYVDDELYSFSSQVYYELHPLHTFPMDAELLAAIIKHLRRNGLCTHVDAEYLNTYIPLDHTSAAILLEDGQYQSHMRDFVTDNEIRARLVRGLTKNRMWYGLSPEIGTTEILMMLIAEWRSRFAAGDIKYVRESIAKEYTYLYYNSRIFARNVAQPYYDDLSQLFPLIVMKLNVSGPAGLVIVPHELTAANCPLDLIDRVMEYSDYDLYKFAVNEYIQIIMENSTDHDYRTNIARLIITKYPKYLQCILLDEDITHDSELIFLPNLLLPEYNGAQLILENINSAAPDFYLVKFLHRSLQHLITIDIINEYIHVLICMEQCLCAHKTDRFCTLDDLIQINLGICGDKIMDADRHIYIGKLMDDGYANAELKPINEISYARITELICQNANVINRLDIKDAKIVLPLLYENFWRRILFICRITARMNLPADIADLIKLFFIKPSASAENIAQMMAHIKL